MRRRRKRKGRGAEEEGEGGAATLAGVYAMYFAACKRYQEHGIKLWGNEEGAKQGSR